MGSPSRNVQYHPPRLSEDRLNLSQPHSPSLLTHCSGKSGMRPLGPAAPGSAGPNSLGPSAEPDWFIDASAGSGLDFVHFNGAAGAFHIPEIMAPGAGLLDYDNDGDLDVYLVQGQMLGPDETVSEALFPPRGPLRPAGRLFRNDLVVPADGSRVLRFTDVTDESGIDARGYGMGVATGDIDNDGRIDLYLTHLGRNQPLPEQRRRHIPPFGLLPRLPFRRRPLSFCLLPRLFTFVGRSALMVVLDALAWIQQNIAGMIQSLRFLGGVERGITIRMVLLG